MYWCVVNRPESTEEAAAEQFLNILSGLNTWRGDKMPDAIGTAKLVQAVMLLPKQENLVWARLPPTAPISEGSVVLIEPTKSPTHKKDIIVGRVVVSMTADRWVPVRMLNPYDMPITWPTFHLVWHWRIWKRMWSEIDSCEVSPQWKGQLLRLVQKYEHVFSKHKLDCGRAKDFVHRIHLSDNWPFRLPYRHVPPGHYQMLQQVLSEMEERDIIRKSSMTAAVSHSETTTVAKTALNAAACIPSTQTPKPETTMVPLHMALTDTDTLEQNVAKLAWADSLFYTDVLVNDHQRPSMTISKVAKSHLLDAGLSLDQCKMQANVMLVGCGGIQIPMYWCVVNGPETTEEAEAEQFLNILSGLNTWRGDKMPDAIGTAKLVQAVMLLPNQENLVWARLPPTAPISEGSVVLIEPTKSPTHKKDIIVGRVVVSMTADRWVPVRMLNPYDMPITWPTFHLVWHWRIWKRMWSEIDSCEVSPQWKGQLLRLVQKYEHVFSKHKLDCGRAKDFVHRIHLSDNWPFRLPYRHVPPGHYQMLQQVLSEVEERDIIRKSSSMRVQWRPLVVKIKHN
ncbi:hypothetical protein QTP70_029184 [Hemibagrus guttatus]|uniref:Uncharacterized protein n=1 Tax=Hemibagrus guttatus TaxID=175788 RepID=A0AAE0R0H1_9TELE|nr:hypothetical protein QTP70_029184 [Hemibagrus guttatus]